MVPWTDSDGPKLLKSGDWEVTSASVRFVKPLVDPKHGYNYVAELRVAHPDEVAIGQTLIELPRPSVSINVTKRTWKTVATSTPSPACPKYGIAKNSSIEHQATLVATPAGFLPGNATYEWTHREKPASFQKVPTATGSVTLNFGNLSGEKIVRVVARDGAAGGPFESATSTTELHSPDGESKLGMESTGSGKKSSAVPASSVLPISALGSCSKTNPYSVTAQPMTRLKAEWEFDDLGYRDAKGQSLSKPFCPQFVWQELETRILPDGAWTTAIIRPAETAGAVVHAWMENGELVVKTTDGKPRDFRVSVSATDAVGRQAENSMEFDNWNVEGPDGISGFHKAASACVQQTLTLVQFSPAVLAVYPMLNPATLANFGLNDPVMAGKKASPKAASQSKMRAVELMQQMKAAQQMQSGQPPQK